METAIVSVLCIALIVIGGMTMAQGFFTSVDATAGGLEQISTRDGAIMRTDISTLSAIQPSSMFLNLTLRNSGQTKLASLDKWDLIVQYTDIGDVYHVIWLPYTSGALGDNQWIKEGIYLDAASRTEEVFEPGILNPGEEMIIQAKLNPATKSATAHLVTVSTPNGIPASISFSR
ncbi:MAG: hypothetical protein Q8O05_02505 [Chloroflexota bacterium]|nr:hypothetical protein [Chloroflexota bacterium]